MSTEPCIYRITNNPIGGISLQLEPDCNPSGKATFFCSLEQLLECNCLVNECSGGCELGSIGQLRPEQVRILAEGKVDVAEIVLHHAGPGDDRSRYERFRDFWKTKTDVFPEEDHERLLLFLEFLGECDKDSMV